MERHAALARAWVDEGRAAALLRVTDAAGLGPRATDELLLVDANGGRAGSLLGGAADPALEAAALDLLAEGRAGTVRTLALDIADDDAETAGLTCGGFVNVLVQPLAEVPVSLWDALASGRPAALATAVRGATGALVLRPGETADGTLGSVELDEATVAAARALLTRPGHHLERVRLAEAEVIVEAWHPVPHVVSVGPSALADALNRQAGPRLVVPYRHDARRSARGGRGADPGRRRDRHRSRPRAGDAGARRHAPRRGGLRRRARLATHAGGATGPPPRRGPRRRGAGAAPRADRSRPGARTPAETAVSIVAEVLAIRSGRSAAPLRATQGRIGG